MLKQNLPYVTFFPVMSVFNFSASPLIQKITHTRLFSAMGVLHVLSICKVCLLILAVISKREQMSHFLQTLLSNMFDTLHIILITVFNPHNSQ